MIFDRYRTIFGYPAPCDYILRKRDNIHIFETLKSLKKNNLVIFMHLVPSFECVIRSRSPLRSFIPHPKS